MCSACAWLAGAGSYKQTPVTMIECLRYTSTAVVGHGAVEEFRLNDTWERDFGGAYMHDPKVSLTCFACSMPQQSPSMDALCRYSASYSTLKEPPHPMPALGLKSLRHVLCLAGCTPKVSSTCFARHSASAHACAMPPLCQPPLSPKCRRHVCLDLRTSPSPSEGF